MNKETQTNFKADNAGQETTPYRHQILQHLLEHKDGLGIDSVAAQMTISRTAVQQHFLVLEKEGLIKRHDRVKTHGRPSIRYVLTDAGVHHFPKDYLGFSHVLLQTLKEELGAERLTVYLKTLGVKLAQSYIPRFEGKSGHERILIMTELMHELGFHARLFQDGQSEKVEIRAYNCIYHDLARQFEELCAFDLALIEELLGNSYEKKIELHGCIAKGCGCCCFKIEN